MCQILCDVTSSNVLGRLVKYEQKGGTGGGGLIIYGENSMAVSGFDGKVLENCHLTS